MPKWRVTYNVTVTYRSIEVDVEADTEQAAYDKSGAELQRDFQNYIKDAETTERWEHVSLRRLDKDEGDGD